LILRLVLQGCRADGAEICLDARPSPVSSPAGRGFLLSRFRFANDCPAHPIAGIFQNTGTDSPSPWGEGRDEGDLIYFSIEVVKAEA
jgi:hypothetical protein